MDAFSKGIERRIDTAPAYLKPVLQIEASRLARYEYEIFNEFDHKTIISEQDKALISHPNREQIHVIPNGVDTNYFHPIKQVKDVDIVFTGNMNYPPNVDCACYIVKKILPLLSSEFPEIKILISGTNPSSAIKSVRSN